MVMQFPVTACQRSETQCFELAEKNRNGRISDNGSNLSNKLPDRISGRVIRLVEKYIHLGNPNQPLSSRYSFGDFPVILLKYLPKKDCDGKCKESQTC